VELLEITPAFVIKARRPNHSIVFVNICSCPEVPFNPTSFQPEGIIFMVVGEIGHSFHDHTVYDIAVSPYVIETATKNAQVFHKVSFVCCFCCFSPLIMLLMFFLSSFI
jgi:hypothetical protein